MMLIIDMNDKKPESTGAMYVMSGLVLRVPDS